MGDVFYLSGPMSGLPHFNYPTFIETANMLRHTQGYRIHNPAESPLGLGMSRTKYLKEDIQFITSDECAGVVVLPGWRHSPGARVEVLVAYSLNKSVRDTYGNTIHVQPDFLNDWTSVFTDTSAPLQIAINGKMRSGKDTLAKELARLTRVPVDRFAAPLKEGCEKFGCGDGEIVKDRVALQDIGQYFVARNPRWWVNLIDSRNPNRKDTGLILPDLRSKTEFDWCKENGILTVRLEVDRETQIERGAEPDRVDHITETGLDDYLNDFDFVFESGTDLGFMVNSILDETGTEERLQEFVEFNAERIPSLG